MENMTQEELSKVNGGNLDPSKIPGGCSKVQCTNCSFSSFWAGLYEGTFDCPYCYQHTLIGTNYNVPV